MPAARLLRAEPGPRSDGALHRREDPPEMRLRAAAPLGLALAACCLAGAARAAPPAVDARAWLVENERHRQVLAAHDDRYQVPIASITKLMTVIVALEHLKLERRRHRRSARRRCRAGDDQPRRRPADHRARPREGGPDPVGERRRRRARARGRPELPGLRRPDERQGAAARAHRLPLRPAGRARRPRRVLERPRRDAARPGRDEDPDRQDERRPAGLHDRRRPRRCTPGTTCSACSPACSASRRATRRRPAGGRSRRLGARGRRSTSPSSAAPRAAGGTPTSNGCSPTGSPSTGWWMRSRAAATTPMCSFPTGRRRSRWSPPRGSRPRCGSATRFTQRVVAPTFVALPVREGQVLGRVQIWSGTRLVGERALVASRSVPAPGLAARVGWYARRTVHNLVSLLS